MDTRSPADVWTGQQLAARAYEEGEIVAKNSYRLNFHGSCTDPVRIWRPCTVQNADSRLTDGGDVIPVAGDEVPSPVGVEILARCRKCARCRRAKVSKWVRRAVLETALSQRTWAVTLTFTPEQQLNALYAVEAKHERAVSSEWSPSYRFQKLADHLGVEVTKWFKRLRMPRVSPYDSDEVWDGAQFRYLIASEPHKTNARFNWERPHFHVLLHEKGENIVYRRLEYEWKHFNNGANFHAKLVRDLHQLEYVCKYVAHQDKLPRVRASFGYGKLPKELVERCSNKRQTVVTPDPPPDRCYKARGQSDSPDLAALIDKEMWPGHTEARSSLFARDRCQAAEAPVPDVPFFGD